MKALGRHFGEILAFDPYHGRERHLARAHGLVLGVVGEAQGFFVRRRQIGQGELQRVEYGQAAWRGGIKHFAHAAFEYAVVDDADLLGNAHAFPEQAQRRRRIAAAKRFLQWPPGMLPRMARASSTVWAG